jgi:hypothetical protein
MNLKDYNTSLRESIVVEWLTNFISRATGIEYLNLKDVPFFFKSPNFTRKTFSYTCSSNHPYFLHVDDVDLKITLAWNDKKIIIKNIHTRKCH